MTEFCRCCMKTGIIDVFKTLFNSVPLADIIQKCTNTIIQLSDVLPKKICQDCKNSLTLFYLFLDKFHKVQEILSSTEYPPKIEVDENKLQESELEQPQNNSTVSITKNKHESKDAEDLESSSNKGNFPSICIQTDNIDSILDGESLCEENSFDEKPTLLQKVEEKNFKSKHKTKVKKIYNCFECNACFHLIKLLLEHCKDTGHRTPRRYQCDKCSMEFLTNTCLKVHTRTHSNEKPHTCEECGMKFSLRSNLQRHTKRHTGEKPFFCDVCGKGFIQKNTLIIHMRLHNGETPYICEECGKGFRCKPLLTQHLKKHQGLETYYKEHYLKHGALKVECEICKKVLTRSSLNTHMKIQHGDGIKKFLCNSCGKTYTSKKSLETHLNVHTKKISYDCGICSKSFTHHGYLKTHIRIHSGEKPHCCDICGKTFTQRGHLDGHMRTHTGVKPYKCKYCDKSFALNGNLKVHMRIHTGETPHRCTVCDKGFFDSSNRKKHESTVHRLHQTNVVT